MAPVETEYYDLLGVPTDADDTALKKAYRRQAMKASLLKDHFQISIPDTGVTVHVSLKYNMCIANSLNSKAYQVLSDPNLRTVYDKNGKKMVDKEGPINIDDAAGFFANVFGGERFVDYIGEISIMKDMTSMATTMMTDEEKAEIEKHLNADRAEPATPSIAHTAATPEKPHAPAASPSTTRPHSPEKSAAESQTSDGTTLPATPHSPTGVASSPTAPSTSSIPSTAAEKEKAKAEAARRKAEQREKMREHDKARRAAMEARIATLTQKMIERLRPFVEAKDPGGKDDPESNAFAQRMKREVEDLKLESFGVELLHTIGMVYMMKASSFMKSRKFLGIPGFFSRLKEKGALAKDLWGVIGSALSVRDLMLEMEKAQAKGELGEEELRALEMDVTGKIMLASWRGARLEVIQVLREVVDNVLKEPGQPDIVLLNRAKALLITGAIFKSAVPDESDEERRELERMVHEAAQPKSKQSTIKAAKARREEMLKAQAAAASASASSESKPATS
ncbi:hypothetical protein CVT24_007868 [Panaeolus cyanescens]|uniref:J domain-containing protein n=1 Tax=Panaeolus cyanescens TaxID=181874 RepID=A0A409VCJ7_9AGAR|nr:hypothetical protein CVT24_007868 [Panaeolus cyanescens]